MSLVPYATAVPSLTPNEFNFNGVSFGSLVNVGNAVTSAASGTGTVTSLAVTAIPVAIPAGYTFMLAADPNPIPVIWTVTSNAAKGATVLSVSGSSTVGTTIPACALTRSLYQFVKADGLDMVDIDGGDLQRPIESGEFIGYDAEKGRTITLQFNIYGMTAAALDSARANLFDVLQAGGSTESPMFFRSNGGITYCLMARCRKFTAPIDSDNVQVFACQVTAEFHSVDPRIYLPTQQAAVTGAGYNAVNAGNRETRPLVTYTAGATGAVTLTITAGGNSIVWNGTLTNGDTLTFDTDFRTVILNHSLVLSSATNGINPNTTTWWNLPPGTTVLAFTTTGTGTFAVTFASAWAGV